VILLEIFVLKYGLNLLLFSILIFFPFLFFGLINYFSVVVIGCTV
jgi:hypothetical protein